VHLLENRPHFYATLNRLGITLEPDNCCATWWRGRQFKMGPARVLFHAFVALNAARRGQIDRFRRTVTSAARSALHIGAPFQYPALGCRELNQRLISMLAHHDITPILGSEITSIEVNLATGVHCSTTEGVISADRVLIGSRAHAPLIIDRHEIRPPLEQNRAVSLVLRGKDAPRVRFSYVELLRDAYFKRVRDVTPFCLPPLGSEDVVLCVQLREAGEQLLASLGPKAIIGHLVDLGLLSCQAELSHTAKCDYAFQTIADSGLRAIERQSRGRVVAVRTTDFADDFRIARSERRRALSPDQSGEGSRA
jgi:hypothetical protein